MTKFESYFTLFKLSFIKKYSECFYQNRIIERNIDNFFNRDIKFFHNSNNVYNNSRQKQNDRLFRLKIIIKMKNSRFELNERDFDRNSQNKRYNKNNKEYDESKDRNKNKYRDKNNKNKNKFKTQTHIIPKNDDENSNENNMNYQNLMYFDSNYDDSNNSKNTIKTNYTTFNLICRCCQFLLSLNNLLHNHIRVKIYFKYLCNVAKEIQKKLKKIH